MAIQIILGNITICQKRTRLQLKDSSPTSSVRFGSVVECPISCLTLDTKETCLSALLGGSRGVGINTHVVACHVTTSHTCSAKCVWSHTQCLVCSVEISEINDSQRLWHHAFPTSEPQSVYISSRYAQVPLWFTYNAVAVKKKKNQKNYWNPSSRLQWLFHVKICVEKCQDVTNEHKWGSLENLALHGYSTILIIHSLSAFEANQSSLWYIIMWHMNPTPPLRLMVYVFVFSGTHSGSRLLKNCFLNENTGAAECLDVWHMEGKSSLGLQSVSDKLMVIMMSHHSL